MMNNAMSQLKRLSLGMGKDPLMQNVFDYGAAGVAGVAGQQAVNMVSGGADPNPFLSGALMAPALAGAGRFGRGVFSPVGSDMTNANARLLKGNPYEQAALLGSASSLGAGALTSGYNTVAGGADIDNNIPASILAAAAPLTAYLLSQRAKSIPVA